MATAEAHASRQFQRHGGASDPAIDGIIDFHVKMAGAQGFVTNLGGLATLAVSIHVVGDAGTVSGHKLAHQTNWVSTPGDHADDESARARRESSREALGARPTAERGVSSFAILLRLMLATDLQTRLNRLGEQLATIRGYL